MSSSGTPHVTVGPLQIRGTLTAAYGDVFTPAALAAIEALVLFDRARAELMRARSTRRAARAAARAPIGFLDPAGVIPGTSIPVADARAGRFDGAEIPPALDRQWIQGTGPAARPGAPVARSLRNVAYALLSGADGWMFDGEDALGQISTMSLDNQRNLALALARTPLFLDVAARGLGRDERLVARRARPGRSSTTGRGNSITPCRSSAPGACTSTTGTSAGPTAPASRPRSSTPPSTSPTTSTAWPRCRDRSSSTCRRSRPPRKPPCGTTCSRRSSGTSAPPTARSRSTCWSSSSRPATS